MKKGLTIGLIVLAAAGIGAAIYKVVKDVKDLKALNFSEAIGEAEE